jgi:hypothetical protein
VKPPDPPPDEDREGDLLWEVVRAPKPAEKVESLARHFEFARSERDLDARYSKYVYFPYEVILFRK